MPSVFTCPSCQCPEVDRLHRRGVDWLLSALGFRPARCRACHTRFYFRASLLKHSSSWRRSF